MGEVPAYRKAFQLAEQVARFGLASEVTAQDLHSARCEARRATAASSGTREHGLVQGIISELLSIVERDLQWSAIRSTTVNSDMEPLAQRSANSLAVMRKLAREFEDWYSVTEVHKCRAYG